MEKEREMEMEREVERNLKNNVTQALELDLQCVALITQMGLKDVWSVLEYVLAYKHKHHELLSIIDNMEMEFHSVKMKARTNNVSSIKKSFKNMLKPSEKTGNYFRGVIDAIEKAQVEQGEVHRDKLTSSGKLHLVDLANVANFATMVKGSVKRHRSRKGDSMKLVEEVEGEGGAPKASKTPITPKSPKVKVNKLLKTAVSSHTSHTAHNSHTAPAQVHRSHSKVHRSDSNGNVAQEPLSDAPDTVGFESVTSVMTDTDMPMHGVDPSPMPMPMSIMSVNHMSIMSSPTSPMGGGQGGQQKGHAVVDKALQEEHQHTQELQHTQHTQHTHTQHTQHTHPHTQQPPHTQVQAPPTQPTQPTQPQAQQPHSPKPQSGIMHSSGVNAVTGVNDSQPLSPLSGIAPISPTKELRKTVHSAPVEPTPTVPTVHIAPEATVPLTQTLTDQIDSHDSDGSIGFDDADADADAEEGSDSESDADIRFIEELESAKQEMMAMQVIQERMESSESENLVLINQVGVLVNRLEKTELRVVELRVQCKEILKEGDGLQGQLDHKEHENQLLREIVQEDYRYHTDTLEKALNAQEEGERGRHRPAVVSDQGTQIACSVCAMRVEGEEPYAHGYAYDDDGLSYAYDEDTVAMANETLGRAVKGVVMVAQPRHINASTKRELLSQLQSSVERQGGRDREREGGDREKEWERGQREKENERELREREQKERDKRDKRHERREKKERDKEDRDKERGFGYTQQEILHHIENVQHQLLNYRDPIRTNAKVKHSSSDQTHTQHTHTQAQTAESKFSRLKKMPTKVHISSNHGPYYFNSTAPEMPPSMPNMQNMPTPMPMPTPMHVYASTGVQSKLKLRPHSASALRLSSARSASHTAAYLQHQHMEDEFVLPLFMPTSSETHGPLSSVAYASNLAHHTNPSLLNARQAAPESHTQTHMTQDKPQAPQRAHSANAAQRERQRVQVQVTLTRPLIRQDTDSTRHSGVTFDMTDMNMSDDIGDIGLGEGSRIYEYETRLKY
jgi:hypothetical protein